MQQRFTHGILLGVIGLLLLPALAAAQSAIVGLITDDSGAVPRGRPPGVTPPPSPQTCAKGSSVTKPPSATTARRRRAEQCAGQ